VQVDKSAGTIYLYVHNMCAAKNTWGAFCANKNVQAWNRDKIRNLNWKHGVSAPAASITA